MDELLTFQDIVDNIAEALTEVPLEEVVRIHNETCSRKVEYLEDSLFTYTGEDDNNA